MLVTWSPILITTVSGYAMRTLLITVHTHVVLMINKVTDNKTHTYAHSWDEGSGPSSIHTHIHTTINTCIAMMIKRAVIMATL